MASVQRVSQLSEPPLARPDRPFFPATRVRLARLVNLGIRQSRYFGRANTKFQLYLAATVANLTLVAANASPTGDTGGRCSVASSLRIKAIRSALEFVPARRGQAMSLALLASTSLPKFITLNKAFRPDFKGVGDDFL